MRHVISALVQNKPGVLAHVAGMFAARGFNIDSLVVGRTEDPDLSPHDHRRHRRRPRAGAGPQAARQAHPGGQGPRLRQRRVRRARPDPHPHPGAASRSGPRCWTWSTCSAAGWWTWRRESVVVELAGTEEKLEAFIELVKAYGIGELARTGVIAMPRGLQKEKPAAAPAEED